jgi:hypothetical protein
LLHNAQYELISVNARPLSRKFRHTNYPSPTFSGEGSSIVYGGTLPDAEKVLE